MTTSNGSIHPAEADAAGRRPLRLALAERLGRNRLDGAWWPQSRDLSVELADLVDHFPAGVGRVSRALVSPPDWDAQPRQVTVADGSVKVGSFPRDDTHVVLLTLADRTVLSLLVVPPGFTDGQGDEALLAAATSGNAHSAADLLAEVLDQPDADPLDHWTDDSGPWWGPTDGPPSFRTDG
jgi:hypothetical protein